MTLLTVSLQGIQVNALDSVCMQAGSAAGGGTFVAWYSTPTRSAAQRLGSASGWVRLDGKPIANTPDDLAHGRMFYPMTIFENQGSASGEVHVGTATRADGTYATGHDCLMAGSDEQIGVADGEAEAFSAAATSPCTTAVHLYCFGVDHHAKVVAPAPPANPRHAFLSATTYPSGVGLGVLDSHCQSEGSAAGYHNVVALVATDTTSASSRVTSGVPYVRPDGVEVFDEQRSWLAPIDMQLDGTQVGSGVWAGAADIGSAGSAADTCNNWSAPGTLARGGDSGRSLSSAFGVAFVSNCSSAQRLYCIEQ